MSDPAILVKNRKLLVEEMKDKYGYLFCINCKKSSGFYKLHVHHIIFRSEAPGHKFLHSKENLLICCNVCHDLFHSGNKFKVRENIVQERGLKLIFDNIFINDK